MLRLTNNNTFVFIRGNPPEHSPVDFEKIYRIYPLSDGISDCYHLELTNCYMEWNPVSFVKHEYFYMRPDDYIIYKKTRYKFDDMPRLIMLIENENTIKAIGHLE